MLVAAAGAAAVVDFIIFRGLSSVIAGPFYFRAFPFVAGGILHLYY